MDELLIEDKKYVSSKRAAKITGYAKDYVGQLCREGRIPARLVGRNWYVLESAIQDHRFGNAENNLEKKSGRSEAIAVSTWENPRYEPEEPVLLQGAKSAEEPSSLQESWKEWFERIADTATASIASNTEEPKNEIHNDLLPAKAEEKSIAVIEEEVPIPIRTVYRSITQTPVIPIEDRSEEKTDEQPIQTEDINRRAMCGIHAAGVLVALLLVLLAALGTGYLDKYLPSNSRATLMAGVILYER